MLAGIGHTYFWAGAGGGEPPPPTSSFNETLSGGLKDYGKRGGFKHIAAMLLAAAISLFLPAQARAQFTGPIITAANCATVSCAVNQVCISSTSIYCCNTGTGLYVMCGSSGGGITNSFSTVGSGTADTSTDTLTINDSSTVDFTSANDPETLTAVVPVGSNVAFDNETNTWTVVQTFGADLLSSRANPGPKWVLSGHRGDNAAISGTTSLIGPQWTVPGAITTPTDAPSLAVSAGGSLPLDTYRCKYTWNGQFGNGWNNTTNSTLRTYAITGLSSVSSNATTTSGNQTITATIPGPYPANATGFTLWCERDGDLGNGYRFVGPGATAYPTLVKIFNATTFFITSNAPTNNTADRIINQAYWDGGVKHESLGAPSFAASATYAPPVVWQDLAAPTEAAYKVGPRPAVSYDSGTTKYRLNDPRYTVHACGTTVTAGGSTRTLAEALALLDGTSGPSPSATSRVSIIVHGKCIDSGAISWVDNVNLVAVDGVPGGFGARNATLFSSDSTYISLTNVDNATFVNVPGLALNGDTANNVQVIGGTIARMTLTNSKGIVVTDSGVDYTFYSQPINVNGGNYAFVGVDASDYSASVGSIASRVPFTIGTESGAGTLTAETHVLLDSVVINPTANTADTIIGLLWGWFDSPANFSTVTIVGANVSVNNGEATQCVGSAPAQGSLLAFNTGLNQDGNGGKVHVRIVGSSLRQRSCEKAIILRTAQLDPGSTVTVLGTNMYAETTGTGTSGVDEDTHCYEGASGPGRRTEFRGGSCVNVNNGSGKARPFYMHTGCCSAVDGTPQILIADYLVRAESTFATPAVGDGFGIGNGCDTNNGCVMTVDNVRIEQAVTDTTDWRDLYVSAATEATGKAKIELRDVVYDTTKVEGSTSYRTLRTSGTLLSAAPAKCDVGNSYTSTSGFVYSCIATDTWAALVSGTGVNTHGVLLWGDSSDAFDTGTEVCAAHGLTCVDVKNPGGTDSDCATDQGAATTHFYALCK